MGSGEWGVGGYVGCCCCASRVVYVCAAIVLHWRHPPGVPSRAPHKVSISSPISRTDVRTYVIRDFPSVADLVPYKEAATLDDRLLNGRCTIRYYPNGQQTGEFKDGLRGSFLLAIRVAAAREEPVRGRYRIRVLNHLPHGRPASKEGTWTWKAMSELLTATGLLTAEILNPEAGWLSAAEKALVLEVEVTVWEGVAAEETVTTRQLQEQATRDLRYHIGTLLPGGAHTGDLFTDMEFRCEGRRFPAHRALLAARSPVFRAMFASAMQESRSGVVEVEDVLPAVLQELLHFLYTAHLSEAPAAGATGEAARWPLDLYAAAHRYQVNSLTRLLEGFLLAEVPAPEALVERLHFAGRFDELRSAVWGHYAALLQRQEDGRAYLRAVQASDAFRRQDTEALRTFLEVCTLTPPAAGRVLADSSAALVGRSPPRRYARKRRRCEGEEAGASEASEFEWRPRLLRVHVARMTAEELTAELEARDLSVLGAVDDLRARLDAALER